VLEIETYRFIIIVVVIITIFLLSFSHLLNKKKT